MTADSTVAEIEASGGTALGIEVDVRDREAVEAMVAQVVHEWGRVDVLVANALRGRHRPMAGPSIAKAARPVRQRAHLPIVKACRHTPASRIPKAR
jgi:NAD(P)-dependent dehydrogenase (short-subunit alcohol dehydrogenase family)